MVGVVGAGATGSAVDVIVVASFFGQSVISSV